MKQFASIFLRIALVAVRWVNRYMKRKAVKDRKEAYEDNVDAIRDDPADFLSRVYGSHDDPNEPGALGDPGPTERDRSEKG